MMDQAYLFNTGKNYMSYHFLGSHPQTNNEGEKGYRFSVWAPHAKKVCVTGDFNQWQVDQNQLSLYGKTGIWTGFVAGLEQWQRYKYAILTDDGQWVLKADPYARHAETRPGTASRLYDPDDFIWSDREFMENRPDAYELKPLNIYEMHLGSWRRYPDGSVYNYRDIAPQLADYILEMGYTAVEFMPLTEYPLDASWGYQVSGYFAATSRYGTPADLKYLINYLHQKGIYVFLDWVPAHFPKDAFGLARFDGTCLYEYEEPLIGEHEDWGTLVFNFAKAEVRSFLFSSAYFWLSEFHFDGLRVDAVSSMIYRDYGRSEYIPNIYGGRENLEVISFFKELNSTIHEQIPGAVMMAEEATSFPMITTGVDRGGLGFHFKWNMGWMNDTLFYNSLDHYQRKYHQNKFNFSMMYAFSERYILPLSHDEVVHGKKTLLGRMPGDYWRKFANLRLVLAYQMAHPGAKLNFMGNEFAPFTEWRFYEELEWFMLDYPTHRQMRDFVRDLNHLYLKTPALWENDQNWEGFKWIKADDSGDSIFAFLRFNNQKDVAVLCILNMTPAVFPEYSFRLPIAGDFTMILNSDQGQYGGSDYLTGFDKQDFYTALAETPESDADAAAEADSNRQIESKDKDKQIDDDHDLVHARLRMAIPPLSAIYLQWKKNNE